MSRIATTTRGNGTVTTNTYTDQNQLASQTTTNAAGQVLEAHSYTYDDHYNPASRTDTYAPRGSATATGGTWTTVYSYDAYDRLIGSAVYAGPLTNGQPTGLPVTTTGYTVDLGGDVVATTKTTRLGGVRPITTKTTSTNTIDDSGRLTAQKTGSTTATQTFDDDGRVLSALDGATTTYLIDGSPATTTLADGTTTTYALWPDGTRRSATSTDRDGTTSTVTYHYGVDGVAVNDTTSDASTPAGTATTASYLFTTGREARTLLPGTAATGKVTGTLAAPIDTGTGVGYYLRDRHTSVTGLVDDTATVTATYAYTDYGAPARADGRPVNQGQYDGGRTNPYTYLGASPRGALTDAATGLLAFTDRTYDPRQGRFTSPDPVDAHNLYQAFNTNPITYLDVSGQIATTDIIFEVLFAVAAIVAVVVTAGAAAAGVAAIAAGEITAAGVISTTAAVLGTAANVVGMATNVMLAAGDIDATIQHKDNWTDPGLRDKLLLAANASAAAAGILGGIQGAADLVASVGEGAEGAGEALGRAVDEPAPVEPQQQVNIDAQPPGPEAPAQQPPPVDAPNEQLNQAPANPNDQVIEGQNANNAHLQNNEGDASTSQEVEEEVLPGANERADKEVDNSNSNVGKALNVAEAAENFKPQDPGTSANSTVIKAEDPIMKQNVQAVSPETVVSKSPPRNFENGNVLLTDNPPPGSHWKNILVEWM
jgi:RHS repeat-associated protein